MPTDPAKEREQIPLPTQEEVQKKYEAAKAAGVSPCMWIPPEWNSLTRADGKGMLTNNSHDEDGFKNPEATEEALERIREGHSMKEPEGPELPSRPDNWSNPFSDFTHIDESEYPSADIGELEKPLFQEVENVDQGLRNKIHIALCGPDRDLLKKVNAALKGKYAGLRKKVRKALQELVEPKWARDALIADVEQALASNTALRDEVIQEIRYAPPGRTELEKEVDAVLKDPKHEDLKKRVKAALAGDDPVGRLKRIVGPGSPGMRRLGLIFEWALYRTTVLMGDINAALEKGKNQHGADELETEWRDRYDLAWKNYIQFLKDLDDHEPEKKAAKLDVKEKDKPSGYGRSLKWACIDPVICNGRIVGARVIIHWNPHSSSNGVPIPHSP